MIDDIYGGATLGDFFLDAGYSDPGGGGDGKEGCFFIVGFIVLFLFALWVFL